MKRTKIETILIFGILILYYALSQIFFVKMGSIYSIIINPLFWILLCVSLKLYIKKTYAIAKLKKEIVDYTLIAVLGYIIVYLISGLFVSLEKPKLYNFKRADYKLLGNRNCDFNTRIC